MSESTNVFDEVYHLREDNAQLRADNARLAIERDEAKAATDFANLACDRKDAELRAMRHDLSVSNENRDKALSTLATYKAAVVEAREALELARRNHIRHYARTLDELKSMPTPYDHALHTLSALTGDATKPT